MDECKTVVQDIETTDSLYDKQKKDVANMRASLLSFNSENPMSAKTAITKVTALRYYHQLSRIVRYTEMMDRIEDKLYSAIDHKLDTIDPTDENAWMVLMTMQGKLQESMIESQKLLKPYLDMDNLSFVEIPAEPTSESFGAMIMDQDSREKLRNGAQSVLDALNSMDGDNNE